MMRRHLTGNEAAQAVGMLQAGQVQRAVAGHFNVSQSVISRLWNRFQHTGNVAERPRSGRPRKTTVRQDRYLSNMAKRQRFQSAVRLNSDFRTATGVRVSSQTVRNRLHTANMRAYRYDPFFCPVYIYEMVWLMYVKNEIFSKKMIWWLKYSVSLSPQNMVCCS